MYNPAHILCHLFLTNDPFYFSYIGGSDIGISDHCLVYVIRICFTKPNPKIVMSRWFKDFKQT